jgi:NAD(P)-dependent dehydrogenase (short-subunit alcohol dehydrogenase family)
MHNGTERNFAVRAWQSRLEASGGISMKVLVIGATGTIGKAVVQLLSLRHEVIGASHRQGILRVDLADRPSIERLLGTVGRVDAVVCAAGQAKFGPLASLTDDDFRLSVSNKLLGQVTLSRLAMGTVADGGSITLTSGILARKPMAGGAAISMVNAGLEGFVRSAALEMPRKIRINAVSPGWVSETLKSIGRDPSEGTPAAAVARAYVESVEGKRTGEVIEAAGGR